MPFDVLVAATSSSARAEDEIWLWATAAAEIVACPLDETCEEDDAAALSDPFAAPTLFALQTTPTLIEGCRAALDDARLEAGVQIETAEIAEVEDADAEAFGRILALAAD